MSKYQTILNIFLVSAFGFALMWFLILPQYKIMAAPEHPNGFAKIPGGTFLMGSSKHYREEHQLHNVTVKPFQISKTEITNAQFKKFIQATNYVTRAEKGFEAKEHPDWPKELLAPGGMVFTPPFLTNKVSKNTSWWKYVKGANWRHPSGPQSTIVGKDNHPVVQISHEDAEAYAKWAKGRLPTEAEWEFAARGGLENTQYIWGDTYDPSKGHKANTWQGTFPYTDQQSDGYHGTAPVASYEPNGYGLYDMAGNVWEYASDWWVPGHQKQAAINPIGPAKQFAAKFSPRSVGVRKVIKGGSWLCAPSYCLRYRPSARQPQELGLGSNHIGFRIVKSTS